MYFEDIDIKHQSDYLSKLEHFPYFSSEYTFINLLGWADYYGLKWTFDGEIIWIKQTKPKDIYWSFIGDFTNISTDTKEKLKNIKNFVRIPKAVCDILSKHIDFNTKYDRDHYDYIYSTKELIELKGNRFHKKKNHLNQFLKHYNHTYKSINASLYGDVLKIHDKWLLNHQDKDDGVIGEYNAVKKILDNWDNIKNIVGGIIYVDDKPISYTIGEKFIGETIVVHFEKSDIEYRGIYQAINSLFLRNEFESNIDEYKQVNREQDIGSEGLRKAKLSYHPICFIEKCEVSFD